MARIFPPLCRAAGFLAVAVWASWSLRNSSPAAASANAATMASAEVTRSSSPAMLPARGAEQDHPVAAMAASQSESTHDDPERLEQFLKRVVTFNDDGSLRGVRVYPGWNEQVFDEAGLEAGDLLDSLGRAAAARVTVERDAVLAEFMLWFP